MIAYDPDSARRRFWFWAGFFVDIALAVALAVYGYHLLWTHYLTR